MKFPSLITVGAMVISALGLGATAQAQAEQAPCPNFEITGEGPDLVLVPGLGSSPEVWDETVAKLSGDYRIHRVHVAGFAGRAAKDDPANVVEDAAAEIIRHLDCAEVESALYAGHSMGGFLGLKLAAEHGDRIERLVVVDALPFYSLIFSPLATAEAVRPQADGFRAQILSQDDAAFEAGQRMGVRSLVKTSEYHDQVVGWSLASDRAAFAHAIHGLMTTDLRTTLPSIEAPATVLVAANAFAPRARMEALYSGAYEGLEGVTIDIIEDSYHFIMFDQPEA
ncbi:MAG: alpha/beta hydrolase, partial [Pseudomonadota bacterium]